jgi:hypothetical protein
VVRTEYRLGVINIFDFLSTDLGESEEDDKFLLLGVELVLLVPRLLVDWATILHKCKDRNERNDRAFMVNVIAEVNPCIFVVIFFFKNMFLTD